MISGEGLATFEVQCKFSRDNVYMIKNVIFFSSFEILRLFQMKSNERTTYTYFFPDQEPQDQFVIGE